MKSTISSLLFAAVFALISADTYHYEAHYEETHSQSVSVVSTRSYEATESHSHSVFIRPTKNTGRLAIFSYYADKQVTAFYFDMDRHEAVYVLHGEEKRFSYQFTATKWTHFCLTRNSQSGDVSVYLRGEQIGRFEKFRQGESVAKGGNFVVGQYHESENSYSAQSQYQGGLSEFNTYTKELKAEQVKSVASYKEIDVKKSVSWTEDFRHSDVTVKKSTLPGRKCSSSCDSSSSESKESKKSGSKESSSESKKSCKNLYDVVLDEQYKSASLRSTKTVDTDLKEYSIASFVKISKVSQDHTIVSYGSGDSLLAVYSRQGSIFLTHGKRDYRLTQKTVIEEDKWTHVTVTKSSAGVATLYINGKRVEEQRNVGVNQVIARGGSVVIGRRQDQENTRLIGRVSRTIVTSHVLEEKDVREISKVESNYKESHSTTIVGSKTEYFMSGYSGVTETTVGKSEENRHSHESEVHEVKEPGRQESNGWDWIFGGNDGSSSGSHENHGSKSHEKHGSGSHEKHGSKSHENHGSKSHEKHGSKEKKGSKEKHGSHEKKG